MKNLRTCGKISAGASLVGGCCGTTTEHIQALADMLNQKK
ncbi:MAG: homocysteine S-methyltransferase family protein [Planctomycetota bacterium]